MGWTWRGGEVGSRPREGGSHGSLWRALGMLRSRASRPLSSHSQQAAWPWPGPALLAAGSGQRCQLPAPCGVGTGRGDGLVGNRVSRRQLWRGAQGSQAVLQQEAGKGPWEGEVHEVQHEVSSGGALGPAAHPQLSVPASISRVAPLPAWMDRPTSPKAAELRLREAEPLAAAKSKNKTKQKINKQKPRIRKAERSQESRNRDPPSEASSVRSHRVWCPVSCVLRAEGKALLKVRGACCLLSGPGFPRAGPVAERQKCLLFAGHCIDPGGCRRR